MLQDIQSSNTLLIASFECIHMNSVNSKAGFFDSDTASGYDAAMHAALRSRSFLKQACAWK